MSKITHQGELQIADITIPCYVTDSGTRLLAAKQMQVALSVVDKAGSNQTSGKRLDRFLNQKSLEPLFNRIQDRSLLEPVNVKYKGRKISGYDARILPEICDVMLQGRREDLLVGDRQKIIAKQCEILLAGFARVGLIALIDEVTGYQYDRKKDELSRILEAYIAKELLPWAKRFPDEFYKEMFRLRGWKYPTIGNARPGVVGKWTNDIVYERMPAGVLEELKKQNPKDNKGRFKNKHHQYLTPDIGNAHLEKHLTGVIALMRASSNWDNFKRNLVRAYPKKGEQLDMF